MTDDNGKMTNQRLTLEQTLAEGERLTAQWNATQKRFEDFKQKSFAFTDCEFVEAFRKIQQHDKEVDETLEFRDFVERELKFRVLLKQLR